MAAFNGITKTPTEVALAAATAKTVLQLIAPANHRLRILRWGVYFDGTNGAAEPVEAELVRQSTAGTMTSGSVEKLDDSIGEALQATAQHTATVEPTTGDVVDPVEVHPQQGFETVYPPGQEVIVGGGDRIAIRCTAPAVVNVKAKIVFEE